MILDIAEFKSRKALANIINQQVEVNETLSQENQVLSKNQSQLLNLLKIKDGKVQKYKAKLDMIQKCPQLEEDKVVILIKQIIENKKMILLRASLKLFYKNNKKEKNTKQVKSKAVLMIQKSLTKFICIRSHIFFSNCIASGSTNQNKQYKQNLALKIWSNVNIVHQNKSQQYALQKIIDFVRYKEKAFIQIQYYQLKTFSRNFIFMVKLNQLINKKEQSLLVKFFCTLQSNHSYQIQSMKQFCTTQAYNKLVNSVNKSKQLVFNKIKPLSINDNYVSIFMRLENKIKHLKKNVLILGFRNILLFSRGNFNPFTSLKYQTKLLVIRSKNIVRVFSQLKKQKIVKYKATYQKTRHQFFRSKIMKQKQNIAQLNTHFKDSMSQFMMKSSEMMKIFEITNQKQDGEQKQLRQIITNLEQDEKEKIQEFRNKFQQMKDELSSQVSQKVEIEMLLHEKEQECIGVSNKIQFVQKELNQSRYEIQRINEQEKKITQNIDLAYKDKYETAQKLEESYKTLRQLVQEYENLKQGYQKIEKYNRDLLGENDEKQQQINHQNNKMEELEVTVELLHVKLNHQMQQSQIIESEAATSRYSSRTSSRKSQPHDQSVNDQMMRLKSQNMEITKEAIQLNEEKLQMKQVIGTQAEQVNLLQTSKLQQEQKIQYLTKLVEETSSIKGRDQIMQQKLNKLESENLSLQQKLSISENNSENIKKHFYVQLQHQTTAKDKLQSQIEIQNKRHDNDSQDTKDELEQLKAGVGDLNREKINLMRELTLEHESKLKSEKECNNLKDQAKTYQHELDSYQSQLDLYVKVLKQMDEKIKQQSG